MIEEIEIDCPYCGARFITTADASAGDQDYVEDCQICCRPIEFALRTDPEGHLLGVEVRRDDE